MRTPSEERACHPTPSAGASAGCLAFFAEEPADGNPQSVVSALFAETTGESAVREYREADQLNAVLGSCLPKNKINLLEVGDSLMVLYFSIENPNDISPFF